MVWKAGEVFNLKGDLSVKVRKNYQEQLGRGTKEEGNHRCKEGKRGWNERFEAF